MQTFRYLISFLFAVLIFLPVPFPISLQQSRHFALNQKTPTVMISFLLIGIANLLIAILNYARGDLFHDDHFEPAILNVFCTLAFLSIFITMFLKKLVTDRRNAEIEEADEEEE